MERKDENKAKYNKFKLSSFLIEIVFLILGSYFISLGINMFLLPHKFTTGGASGIATILYYVANFPLGITVLVINLPLFLISILKLGKEFSIKTIFSTVLLSIFLDNFKYESFIERFPLDPFPACIFGGLVVGLGLSLVFKTGASTGGSDLLAQIIYRLTSVQSLSQILLFIEIFIISSTIIVFKDINVGLYSIMAMYISTKVIDVIFEGIYYTKVATIITQSPDEIIDGILNDLKRGATIIDSKGAHTKNKNTTITCIITRPQIAKLKSIIRQCDNNAIVYISTANEVIGRGFKNIN